MKSLMSICLTVAALTLGAFHVQAEPSDRKIQVEQLSQTYNAVEKMSESEFRSLFAVMIAKEESAGRLHQADALKKMEPKITKADFLGQLKRQIDQGSTNGIYDATGSCGYFGIGEAIRCFFGIIFTILTLDGGEAQANF